MTSRVGLLGWPVEGSLSPLLHQTLYGLTGVDAMYDLWPLTAEDWPADFPDQVRRGWLGLNVTTPHKERAWAACDHGSEAAAVLAAVNHIWVRQDGALLGDNKDVDGAYFTLQGIRAARPERSLRQFQTVHLLGCGPAARAVLLAYLRFWRAERTRERAAGRPDPGIAQAICYVRRPLAEVEPLLERLRETAEGQLAIRCEEWHRLPSVLEGLLVNATTAADPGPLTALPDGAYDTWDLNYRTPALVRQALESGRYAIDGLPMLVWQGFFSAARWFPRQIDPQRQMGLAKQLLDELRAAQTTDDAPIS